MKAKCSFILAISLSLFVYLPAQEITVGTYNLRYDNKNDSGNLWINRAPIIISLLRFHDFDIFGTQEGLKHQLEAIKEGLPGYSYYGIGRDDGKEQGEYSAIFLKAAKYKVLNSGNFWLSETPEKPGPGWDARLNRICSWVYVLDIASKTKLYFFNVHFDHQGIKARQESSKLLLRKMKEIAGNERIIFSGDLNGGRNSDWYQTLSTSPYLEDTYQKATIVYANNGSFNTFGKQPISNEVIDHIFMSKGFSVEKWGILTDTYYGKYPSDHFPILVTLKMSK